MFYCNLFPSFLFSSSAGSPISPIVYFLSDAPSLRNGCSKIQRPLRSSSLYFAKEASPLLTPFLNPCNDFQIDTCARFRLLAQIFYPRSRCRDSFTWACFISFPFHVTYISHNMLHVFPIISDSIPCNIFYPCFSPIMLPTMPQSCDMIFPLKPDSGFLPTVVLISLFCNKNSGCRK